MTTIEKRLANLEDIQAINNIITHYSYFADQYKYKGKQNIEELANLFAVNGIWEVPGQLKGQGRSEIIKIFEKISNDPISFVHFIMSPRITIFHENAQSTSNVLTFSVDENLGKTFSQEGLYEIDYIKSDEEWKIKHLKFVKIFD